MQFGISLPQLIFSTFSEPSVSKFEVQKDFVDGAFELLFFASASFALDLHFFRLLHHLLQQSLLL